MTALYQISNDILKLMSDEEIPVDCLADTLESLGMEFDDKAENIIKLIKNENADIAAYKAEAKRLLELAAKKEKLVEQLTKYLGHEMQKLGKKSLKIGVHQVSTRKGTTVVNITDESRIDDEFMNIKTTVTPDKKALLKALKDGQAVFGAELKQNPDSVIIK